MATRRFSWTKGVSDATRLFYRTRSSSTTAEGTDSDGDADTVESSSANDRAATWWSFGRGTTNVHADGAQSARATIAANIKSTSVETSAAGIYARWPDRTCAEDQVQASSA